MSEDTYIPLRNLFFFNNERDIECKVASYDVLKCFLEIEKTPGKMHPGVQRRKCRARRTMKLPLLG